MIFYVFFIWLFIDILKISTLISSSIIVGSIFIGKFYLYVLIGLIEPKFIKYTTTNISFSIANVLLLYLLIDILSIPTITSSAGTVVGLFFLRFIIFNKIGLIKRKDII